MGTSNICSGIYIWEPSFAIVCIVMNCMSNEQLYQSSQKIKYVIQGRLKYSRRAAAWLPSLIFSPWRSAGRGAFCRVCPTCLGLQTDSSLVSL